MSPGLRVFSKVEIPFLQKKLKKGGNASFDIINVRVP